MTLNHRVNQSRESERYRRYRNIILTVGFEIFIFTLVGGIFLIFFYWISAISTILTIYIALIYHLAFKRSQSVQIAHLTKQHESTISNSQSYANHLSPQDDYTISINTVTGRVDVIKTPDLTPLNIAIVSTRPICPLCKKENDRDDIFCIYCGYEL